MGGQFLHDWAVVPDNFHKSHELIVVVIVLPSIDEAANDLKIPSFVVPRAIDTVKRTQ
jgi:hypothetical protein